MKIALTGASGHLGSAILPELYKRNHTVKVLVREQLQSTTDYTPEIVKGHLLNQASLNTLLNDCDSLIHCAALISVNGDPKGLVHQTNVAGTKMIMETAQRCGVKRVIHISSIHAYKQQPCFSVLDEKSTLADQNAFAYDRSKRAGQEIALSMNSSTMEVLVMNPTSIIGPYDFKPSKLGKALIDIYKGKLPFIFDGGFDFCDCRDIAAAIVNGLTKGRAGQNYLLAGKWYHFQELASMLLKVSGKNIKVKNLPIWIGKLGLPLIHALAWIQKEEPLYTGEALEALASGNRCISSAKAIEELDYHPRPLEETLSDTVFWFRQMGYLV